MKKIIIFQSIDAYDYFENNDATKAVEKYLDSLDRDGKTYMITIEEIDPNQR